MKKNDKTIQYEERERDVKTERKRFTKTISQIIHPFFHDNQNNDVDRKVFRN